jgi:hypothetical protein
VSRLDENEIAAALAELFTRMGIASLTAVSLLCQLGRGGGVGGTLVVEVPNNPKKAPRAEFRTGSYGLAVKDLDGDDPKG